VSAFMCSDEHIRALVTYATADGAGGLAGADIMCERRSMRRFPLPREVAFRFEAQRDAWMLRAGEPHPADAIGEILRAQNERSVNARYPHHVETWVSPTYRHVDLPLNLDDAGLACILAYCDCYDYQACESGDYETTTAHAIIASIRADIMHHLKRRILARAGIEHVWTYDSHHGSRGRP
jgi:hypothetical protein